MKPTSSITARFVFDASLTRFLTLELCSNLFAIDYLDGRRDVTRGQYRRVWDDLDEDIREVNDQTPLFYASQCIHRCTKGAR